MAIPDRNNNNKKQSDHTTVNTTHIDLVNYAFG